MYYDADVIADYKVNLSNGTTIEDEFSYCNGTVYYGESEIGIATDISDGNSVVSEYVEENMAELLNISDEEAENITVEDVITVR